MNKLKLLSSAFIMALTLAAPLATYAMEPEADHGPARTSRPFNIHTYMALSLGLIDKHMNAIYHSTPQLANYQRFLNGKLIYKPNLNSDEGMVMMRISDLFNPLEGEFDLSKCGDAAQYLSINTGYRKGKRPENTRKVEIWFAPHFLIKNNLEGSTSHFKDIMDSWDPLTAPVGMFFTQGDWDKMEWYEYIIHENFDIISDGKNLYEKHQETHAPEHLSPQHSKVIKDFRFTFELK